MFFYAGCSSVNFFWRSSQARPDCRRRRLTWRLGCAFLHMWHPTYVVRVRACFDDQVPMLLRWYVAVRAARRHVRAAAPSRPRARRCAQEIYKDEGSFQALETLWRLPFLYLAVLGVRGVCILLLNPLFKLAGTGAARARRASSSVQRARQPG